MCLESGGKLNLIESSAALGRRDAVKVVAAEGMAAKLWSDASMCLGNCYLLVDVKWNPPSSFYIGSKSSACLRLFPLQISVLNAIETLTDINAGQWAPHPVSVHLSLSPLLQELTSLKKASPGHLLTPVAMENLSELQNPLLDKNSKHLVNGYGGDFPNNQYQENIINYYAGGGGEGGGGGNVNNGNVVSGGSYNTNGKIKSQQLLDATSLHLAVEAFYRPNFILYKEDSGSIKAKEYKSECCETTFTEKKAKEASNTTGADTPATEDPQAKLLEDGENIKIQTVSYEVEEEEYVEYEVREKMHEWNI